MTVPPIAFTTEEPTFTHRLALPSPAEVASWRLDVPARGACYMLVDPSDRPILLATTRNLRSSLVNRMDRRDGEGTDRRTDYAAVTGAVYWRPAFSRFEADWAHLELARRFVPGSYRTMVEHRRAWWLHVDPEARHPRFIVRRRNARSDNKEPRPGCWIGPVATRAAGRAAIETLEELFDLCRYFDVLREAPHGAACAYKEMGKCPAPCDGSVSMASYRRQIEAARAVVSGGLDAWREARTEAMREAARGLDFESAARIKSKLEQASALEAEALAMAGPIERFRRLALMPGRRRGCVRAFAVLPGRIAFLGECQKRSRERQLAWLAGQAGWWLETMSAGAGPAAEERLELAAWHLMRPTDQREGRFLAPEEASDVERLGEAVEAVGGSTTRSTTRRGTAKPGAEADAAG